MSVTIILPTYNRASVIRKAILSVQNQTTKNWQLIVVDDGSSDETEKVVSDLEDSRLTYIRKSNGGASSARNLGWSRAKTKWVMYLDSDDELLPRCVERVIYHLEKNNAVFGFPRADRKLQLYEQGKLIEEIDDSSDTPQSFSIEDIFQRRAGFSVNGLAHLNSIRDFGMRWDESLGLMEDWELMLSIGARFPDGFAYVPEVLQKYRQRFNSDNLVSQTTYSDWADAFDYIYNKHKEDKTLAKQTWYPAKAEKWRKRQTEYENGLRPPYYLHYFS